MLYYHPCNTAHKTHIQRDAAVVVGDQPFLGRVKARFCLPHYTAVVPPLWRFKSVGHQPRIPVVVVGSLRTQMGLTNVVYGVQCGIVGGGLYRHM